MFVKMLTHLHLVVLAHLQRRIVGVELDQLREERKVFWCALNYVMALGLEFCIDPLCFGSNMQVGCSPLNKFSKMSKIIEIRVRS